MIETNLGAIVGSDPVRDAFLPIVQDGPRILIVEDEPLVAQDLACMVRDLGGSVVGVAGDLTAAVQLAELHQPDGAFIDLNLSDGASGCELAELFSQDYRLAVVIVTGAAEQVPPGFRHALALIEKPLQTGRVRLALALVARLRRGPDQSDAM